MRRYRTWFVGLVTLLVYGYLNIILLTWTSWFLYNSQNLLPLVRFSLCCVLIWLLHFASIEIQTLRLRGRYVFVLLAYIFWCIWWYIWWVEYIVYVLIWIFHVWILILLSQKRHMFREFRYISTWRLTSYGARHALLYITLVIAGLLAIAWQSYELRCDQLYTWWERITGMAFWEQKTHMDIDDFQQATIWDLLWIQEEDITKLVNDILLLEKTQKITAEDNQDTLFSSLWTWKNTFLEQLTKDKDIINQWFCLLVLEQIDTKKDASWFIYSTMILLFFILYPLVKICSFGVSCICFVFMWLCEFLGIYVREEKEGIVEVIN